MHLHRNRLIHHLRARPRLIACAFLGLALANFLPSGIFVHLATRLLLAWNISIWLYLILAGIMIARSSHEKMRWRACVHNEGKFVVLIGVILATVASLGAIFAELATVKDITGFSKVEHIGLAVLTIVSSWAFIHLMFALNYAHDFYLARTRSEDGGLLFPGTELPDYADFLYFSGIIGTSGQTADVSITTQPMRRLSLVHCILAYAFNTSVLALTINIASGLL